MKKKILSIMLALCMVLTMLPITEATAAAATYDLTQGSVIIDDNSPANITINQSVASTANTIQITGTKNHNVTLNELHIKSNRVNSPVAVDSSGTTTLTLNNINTLALEVSSQMAAVRKTAQGTLIIAGNGTLSASGGYFSDGSGGAAIGGNDGESTANIIIQSGTIQATSLSCAAAIGGGNMGSATNIQITGGNVSTESANGAAIGGGGNYRTGGVTTYTGRNIVISGGTVKAYAHNLNKCMAIGDGNVGSSDGYGMDTSGWGNVLQPPAGMVSKVEYYDNGTKPSFDGNYGTNQKANITRFGSMQISFVAGHRLTVQNGAGSGLYLTGKPVNISTGDAGYVEFSKWTLTSGSAAIADTASKATTLTMGSTDVTVTAIRTINYDSLKFVLSPVAIKGESGKTQQFAVGATYNGTALTADQMAGLSYTTAWSLTGAANSAISNTGLLTMGTETENIKVNAAIHAGGKTYTAAADVLYKEADAGGLTVSGGLPGSDYTYADNVLTFTGSGTYLVGMKSGVATAATRIVVNGGSPKITLQNVKIGIDSNAQSIFCVLTGSPSVTIIGTNSLINYNGNDNSNGIRVMNGHLTLDGGEIDTLDVQGNYYSVIILRGGSLTIKGGHYLFGKSSYNIGSIKVDYNATCEVLGGIMELQSAYQGRDCNVITADGDFRIIPAEGKQAAYKVKDSTKYLTEPYSTGTVKFYKTKIAFSDSLPAITAASTGAAVTSAGITVNGTSSATGYYRLYEGGVSTTPLAGDIMGSATGTVDLSNGAVSPASLTGLKEGTAYDCCIVAAAGSGESTQVSKVVKVSFTTQLTPMTASFDKYASSTGYQDISVPLTLSGNTLSDIKNGSAELEKDTDYTVSGSTVTIKIEYLAGLKTGDTALTFHFSTGATQTLKVGVTDSTPMMSPTTASFDKYASSDGCKDISVMLTQGKGKLSDISNGAAELVKDTDYTVSDDGGMVTILKSYLATLMTGDSTLTFHFGTDKSAALQVTVKDSTPSVSTISPTSAGFDKNEEDQSDITVTMTFNGNTLSGIKDGSTELEKGTDYTVSGSTVTIKKEYLADLKTGNTKLVFHFSAGADQTLTVSVGDAASSSGIISAFESLGSAVSKQSVAFGTAFSKINLPDLLKATVDGVSSTWVKVAEWVSSVTYNPQMPGTYNLTPILDSGYQLKDSDVQIPHIRVTVNARESDHSSSGSYSSSHSTPSPSSSVTDALTGVTIGLSGASFSSNVTKIALSVTSETSAGLPQGVPGGTVDLQAATAYKLAVSNAALNVIGSPLLYNIKLLDQNGNAASFTGSTTVRIPVPVGLRGTPHVFHYEESTGTLTDMNASVENEFLMFSTTHFSNYIVAGTGDSITLDTKSYQMPVNGRYQIGINLTGSKAATVKVHSTNDRTATAARLTNGNVQVNGKNPGTVWIMIDVYDNKNHLLTHASVRVDVKTGIRPRGDSARQIGIF